MRSFRVRGSWFVVTLAVLIWGVFALGHAVSGMPVGEAMLTAVNDCIMGAVAALRLVVSVLVSGS